LIGNLLELAKGGDSTFKIAGVPEDDRGDEEVQTGRPMLLVFVCAVPDFTKPVNEDRPSQAVARLAFVEFAAGPAAQFRILQSVECSQCALQPSQFPERCGDTVLAWI